MNSNKVLFCANCNNFIPSPSKSKSRQKATMDEILISKLSPGLNRNSSEKTIKVDTALSDLYNLNYLTQLEILEKEENFSYQDEEIVVCDRCKNILVNLYNNYFEFNQLRQMESFLSKKILRLNRLIGQVGGFIKSKERTKAKWDDNLQVEDQLTNFMEIEWQEEIDEGDMSKLTNDENDRLTKNDNQSPRQVSNSEEEIKIKIELETSDEATTSESDESESELLPSSSSARPKFKKIPKKPSEHHYKIQQIPEGVCPLCPEVLKTPSEVTKHLMGHVENQTDDTRYPCPIPKCSKSSKTKESLKSHIKRHAGDLAYQCPLPECTHIISEHRYKAQHIQSHYQQNIFICGKGKCLEFFSSMQLLQDHWSTVHKQINICPACPHKFFQVEKELDEHVKVDHPEAKLFRCHVCAQEFIYKKYLTRHLMRHDPTMQKCPGNCGKKFATTKELDKHREVCSGKQIYDCSKCTKSFREREAFVLHERIHKGQVKEIKCPHPGCDKIFYKPKLLRYHMVAHSDVKSYTCDQCGIGFKYKSGFTRHLLMHTDNKSHLCSKCGKSFLRSEALKRHMKTHSSAREHRCKVCNKEFKYSESLRLHFVTQHQESPSFHCQVCEAKFPYNFLLQRHVIAKHEQFNQVE